MLSGLLADVTREKVAGLLEQRQPDIITSDDPADIARFEARVTGAGVEVIFIVGADRPASPLRTLAVEAIALQTASEIEYAEFPEQQAPGDEGRGYHLHQRYLELLAQLRQWVSAGGGDGGMSGGGLAPSGSFPAADPAPVDLLPPRRWAWDF